MYTMKNAPKAVTAPLYSCDLEPLGLAPLELAVYRILRDARGFLKTRGMQPSLVLTLLSMRIGEIERRHLPTVRRVLRKLERLGYAKAEPGNHPNGLWRAR